MTADGIGSGKSVAHDPSCFGRPPHPTEGRLHPPPTIPAAPATGRSPDSRAETGSSGFRCTAFPGRSRASFPTPRSGPVAGSSGEEAPRLHLNSPTVAGAVGAWRHGRVPHSRFTRSATLNGHLLLHCYFVSPSGTQGFRTNPSCRRFPDTASGIDRRHFDGR